MLDNGGRALAVRQTFSAVVKSNAKGRMGRSDPVSFCRPIVDTPGLRIAVFAVKAFNSGRSGPAHLAGSNSSLIFFGTRLSPGGCFIIAAAGRLHHEVGGWQ